MASEYRLVSYAHGGAAQAGVLVGDRVVPAATLLPGDGIDASSALGLLRTLGHIACAACRRGAKGQAQRRRRGGRSQTAGADPLSGRALLRRRQLLGPSGRDGRDRQARHRQGAVDGQRQGPLFLHEDDRRLDHRHRKAGAAAAVLAPGRLGSRARSGDRQDRPQRLGGQRLRRGRRLSDRQRSVGTRPDEARGHAIRHGLGRAEML